MSVRWLGACVLAGLAGGGLLGAAILVASRGELTFAETAELAAPSRTTPDSAAGTLRKGDKLVRAETVASAKQVFKAPMTLRVGDREIIRPRGFTKVSTGLALTTGVYATNIPPFNAMRFYTASEPDRVAAPEPPPAETADADVSVVRTDLASLVLEPAGPALSDADVAAQVAGETRGSDDSGVQPLGALPLPAFLPRVMGAGTAAPADSGFLTGGAGNSPFRSIEVRVVPENVTELPKAGGRAAELAFEDRTVALKRGDGLEAVLVANGVLPDDARAITAALGGRDRASGSESLQLQLLFAPAERPGERRQILRARLVGERGIEAIAAMNDRHVFVSVAPPPIETAAGPEAKPPEGGDEDEEDDGTGARLYDSLYETAAKQDLPRGMIEDLIRIFGTDVDFQRRVTAADGLEILYANEEEGVSDRAEIESVRLTLGNDVRQIFRYQAEDGTVDYLDQDGRSLRKFLLRKPITDAKITSPFGSRFHPILGYSKMHTGVDWGTKIGTPILAAGNGTVIKAEWAGGYGRRTEIQHANGYVTAYNHQSGFARGIVPGAKVRQGQVIGYVGTTGLSTGPHLHYEVIINGRFVDPMKIRVPRGKELEGRTLADFNRQRDQIVALEKRAGTGGPLALSEAR